MDALFNNLPRNKHYIFYIGTVKITALFHEYLPDGTLKVTEDNVELRLNPNHILYVEV